MIKQFTQTLSYLATKIDNLNIDTAICYMFLADRFSMRTYGKTITNLSYLVISNEVRRTSSNELYQLMWNFRPNAIEQEYLDKYISRSNEGIKSLEYDDTILSSEDIRCLDIIYTNLKEMPIKELYKYIFTLIDDFIKDLAIIFLPEDFLNTINDQFSNPSKEELVRLRTVYNESLCIN
jgi:hypothetical protein